MSDELDLIQEKELENINRTYKIKYDIVDTLGNFTLEEIEKEKKVGADAYIIFSIVYDENGDLYQNSFSKDGRTGEAISIKDEFDVWLLWAYRLIKSKKLNDWEQDIVKDTWDNFQDAVRSAITMDKRKERVKWLKKNIPCFHNFQDGITKLNHTYKGSIRRHIAVERVIYRIQNILTKFMGENLFVMWRGMFYVPLIILFGWNCNFPMKDVIQYIRFWVDQTPDEVELDE